MVYEAKLNDYVSYKDGGEVKYGVVTGVGESAITVTTEGKTATKAQSEFAEIAKSEWAKAKIRAIPNFVEVLENAVVSGGIHWFRGNGVLGQLNMSFLFADLVHEFVTKQLSEQVMDMFIPEFIEKDADAYFLMSDGTDALKKGPVVAIIQALILKMIYKKPFAFQLVPNLLQNTVTMYLSNVGDRMFYQDKKKTPQYRYK